jgi:hypothetical protein
LNDDPAAPAQQERRPGEAQRRADQPRMPALLDSGIARAGDHADDARHARGEGGDAAQKRGFQGDMMNDERPLAAIEAIDLDHRREIAEKAQILAPPGERMKRETRRANALAMRRDAGRDRDREARIARCLGHRPPMGPEIPILGDEKDQLAPRAGAHRAGAGRSRARRAS